MRRFVNLFVLLATGVSLSACGARTSLPKTVSVPIAVACENEQVPVTELPAATPSMNLFELTRTALVRLKLLEAENVRLRAANANHCPGGTK